MGIEAGYIRGQLETIGAGARRGQNSRSALKWTHYFLDLRNKLGTSDCCKNHHQQQQQKTGIFKKSLQHGNNIGSSI
jgi:hypothetical protein